MPRRSESVTIIPQRPAKRLGDKPVPLTLLKRGTAQPRAYDPRPETALEDFCRMGPLRSIPRLVETYRIAKEAGETVPCVGLETMYRWSKQNGWRDKALAYDLEQQRMRLEAERGEVVEESKRRRRQRITVAEVARNIAIQSLSLLRPELLARNPNALIQLLHYADQSERRDLGLPESSTATAIGANVPPPLLLEEGVDYSALTDEELDSIESLLNARANAFDGEMGEEQA